MNHRDMLAVLVLLFPAAPCLAQFGGGGGMGMGMMGTAPRTVVRTVEVEMACGKKIQGEIQLDAVIIDSDMGQYQIHPDRVKTLRLSKPAAAVQAVQMISGFFFIEGTVITTSGKEIKGKLQCPAWRLELDFGTLTLDPNKVRTLTFSTPAEPKEDKKAPLSQAKPAPLKITLIEGPNAVALMVSGRKITRLAAATKATGDWIPIELREPVEGQAMPIVGPDVVVYGLGRHVYAFSSQVKRWDVLDLPKGASATPIVGNHSARVEYDGQIHEFSAATGKWKHTDINSLLDAVRNR